MNQVSRNGPNLDTKLASHSPSMVSQHKRPLHLEQDSVHAAATVAAVTLETKKRFKTCPQERDVGGGGGGGVESQAVSQYPTVTVKESSSSQQQQRQQQEQQRLIPMTEDSSSGDAATAQTPRVIVSQPQSTSATSVLPTVPPQVVSPRDSTSGPTATTTISSFSSTSSASSESAAGAVATATTGDPSSQQQPPPPIKSTLMSHLRTKYYAELEYMLREFRKLEQQLLGVKGNGTGIKESSGSRERREKLNSFILHLEDTIRQIDVGCQLESEGGGRRTSPAAAAFTAIAVSTPSDSAVEAINNNELKGKEDEDNTTTTTIEKLEEHILANLLPVKVRLKKQLAAQQGATRNPIGMPAAPRGLLQPVSEKGKGTFAAAAEEKRKQAEAARFAVTTTSAAAAHDQTLAQPVAPSQFGKPLGGGGSSLTQKLHGPTLGSSARIHGYGVGSEKQPVPDPTVKFNPTNNVTLSTTTAELDTICTESPPTRKILYAGLAPGSSQHRSGVSAAAEAYESTNYGHHSPPKQKQQTPPSHPQHPQATVLEQISEEKSRDIPSTDLPDSRVDPLKVPKPHEDPTLTEDERKKLHKERRRRKKQRELSRREKERKRQLLLQQQEQHAAQASALIPKGSVKKGGMVATNGNGVHTKGPRTVEYICALCSEAYTSTCDCNPWWALASHECVKCRKTQIPRIDITSPINAIEYHPALLAHAEEGSSGGNGVGSTQAPVVAQTVPSQPTQQPVSPSLSKFSSLHPMSDSDEESSLSELSDAADLSDDSYDSDDSDDDMPLTEGEMAELESFGKNYEGPKLTPDQASRLLILIGHAQTCPGGHKSTSHRDCCNSVKFLMLHIRDCPGTTSTYDVCPFPWCRKIKHLLYHLVACPRPRDCAICSPITISQNLKSLMGLTSYRQKIQKERSNTVAAAMTKNPSPNVTYVPKGAKAAPYRPPVKKVTVPSKPYKSTVTKYAPPVPSKVTPPVRPGTSVVGAKAPTVVKPSSNGKPLQPILMDEPITPVVAALPIVANEICSANVTNSLSSDNTDATTTLPVYAPIPLKTELMSETSAPSTESLKGEPVESNSFMAGYSIDGAMCEHPPDVDMKESQVLHTSHVGTITESLAKIPVRERSEVAAASMGTIEFAVRGSTDRHGDQMSLKSLDSMSLMPLGDAMLDMVNEGDDARIARTMSVVSVSEFLAVTDKSVDSSGLDEVKSGHSENIYVDRPESTSQNGVEAIPVVHPQPDVSQTEIPAAELNVLLAESAPLLGHKAHVPSTTPEQLQEKLVNSATSSSEVVQSSLQATTLLSEKRNSPPRFPDVPVVVVNQEDSNGETINQEVPYEVPPV